MELTLVNQVEQSGYWVVFFIFIQILIENLLANTRDLDQTPLSVASDLFATVCLCPTKRTLGV